jgi:Mg-chelatase subunit ChlD
MNWTDPHFAEPQWLWLAGLGPVLLIALMIYAAAARRRQLRAIASAERVADLTRSHSSIRRIVKNVLLVLAVLGIGLALARPQWGVHEFAVQELDEDVIFVMDCSRSMLATDIAPNRLERAKLAVLDFVHRQQRGRVGLVAFAGQAFLQCPLTFDHDAFEESLRAIDDKTISLAGTDIGRALEEAYRGMETNKSRKVIVLLTDGEDLEQSGIKTAEALAKQGVVVFTIGVGTATGAEIRTMNEQNVLETVRDKDGTPVRSKLDEDTLRAIATVTKGNYYPLGGLGEGLAKVRLSMDVIDAESRRVPLRKFGIDRFHYFVGVVLLCLVAESLMGTRRKRGE